MSEKEIYVTHLRKARSEHKKWINQVKLLVSGLTETIDEIPLDQSKSEFGRWFYEEAVIFSSVNTKETFSAIEKLYGECYDEYLAIYGALFNKKSGLFSSFFTSNTPSRNDFIVAKNYYEILIDISDELLGKIRILESQMLATSAEKFVGLFDDTSASVKKQEVHAMKSTQEKRYYRGSLVAD
jgi:hypothetical protein